MSVVLSSSAGFPRTHLALIGYRGSGKSTIGPLIGSLGNLDVFDADLLIEDSTGQSIREIFVDRGESGFRDLETATLRRLLSQPPAILSLGGGVILREENRQLLKSCFTVWLTAPLEVLLTRLEADAEKLAQRPSLTGLPAAEEVERLLAEREPLYAACADFTVRTDLVSVESAAKSILQAWQAHDAAQHKR